MTACLRPPHDTPRTPSFGLMPNLAAGPSSFAKTVRSRSRAQHPFGLRAPALLVREELLRPPTLRPLGSPRGSPRLRREDASHRPLQPTLDTSTRRSLDSQARSLRREDRLRDVPRALAPMPSGARRRTTLRQSEPRVEQRLTTPLQLQPSPLRPSFLNEEETSPARRQSYPVAALSAARGPAIRPLTPPVAPRVRLFPGVFGAPGPLPPPSRQRGRLPRSEAPSVDKCSPPARAEGARHRSHSFAAAVRLPALFHPSPCSRMEELDPHRWSRAIHPWSRGPRAACQRLQSIRIGEHNRLIDRAPHTTPESPPAQL